jgi:CrcB protein
MDSLYVAIGGAVGSVARYHLGAWVQARLGAQFPTGTLVVNALGSFLLALLMSIVLRTDAVPPAVRVALSAGVLGGFTTYSSFNHEVLRLAQCGAWSTSLLTLVATVGGCLVAGVLGWTCGRLLVGAA